MVIKYLNSLVGQSEIYALIGAVDEISKATRGG